VQEFDPADVGKTIESALSTVAADTECEIAFFGGSFTGIGNDLMQRLLSETEKFTRCGRVSAIRCSTRPDYINGEVLDILERYGVRCIELGIQSVSDGVLSRCKRGHLASDTERACALIKERGFTLGGQMMIGLPGATPEDELKTAEFIVSTGAKEARIYPTIVFRATELYDMTVASDYVPLTLEDAVARSAAVLEKFVKAGIKVLRIGLCDSDNLHSADSYFAGPNHAALGELVENRLYRTLIEKKIKTLSEVGAHLQICVSPGHVSKVIGQNRQNKEYFVKKYSVSEFKVKEDPGILPYEIVIK
jgi:histone acetyltransferase (RNA polymerase elongator complex component)